MKKVKSIVGLLLISLILTPTLSAATFTHKLSGGVDEMYYYVNSSISSYTSEINDAVYNWVHTDYGDNPIYLYPVSSNYATSMDYYYKGSSGSCGNNGVLAYTTMYANDTSSSINPNSRDWDWAEMNFCSLWKTNTYHGFSAYKSRQGTIAHEMGHAMGLAHNTSSSSIMTQVGSGRAVYKVDSNSNRDIINKYGWYKKGKL